MPNPTFEPGDDICPPWWPRLIWWLHFRPWPGPEPGPNPVNYPPAIDDITASLAIHTLSYLLLDQKAAQSIRGQVEERIAMTAKQLSNLHDKSMKSR